MWCNKLTIDFAKYKKKILFLIDWLNEWIIFRIKTLNSKNYLISWQGRFNNRNDRKETVMIFFVSYLNDKCTAKTWMQLLPRVTYLVCIQIYIALSHGSGNCKFIFTRRNCCYLKLHEEINKNQISQKCHQQCHWDCYSDIFRTS